LDGDKERCLKVGMDDFLSKPVQIDQLRQALLKWSASEKTQQPIPVFS